MKLLLFWLLINLSTILINSLELDEYCVLQTNSLNGTCKLLNDCPKVRYAYEKYSIKPQLCKAKTRIICCPDPIPEVTTTVRPPRTTSSVTKCQEYTEQRFSNQEKYDYSLVKPEDVYETEKKAKPRDFPHLANIFYKTEGSKGKMINLCSGSLISENFVVTSARCASSHSEYTRGVELGRIDKKNNKSIFNISQILIHPQYTEEFINYDIALIELNSTVEFNQFIHPICLSQDLLGPQDQIEVIASWVDKIEDQNEKLKAEKAGFFKIKMRTIPYIECRMNYTNDESVENGIDFDTMLCATTKIIINNSCLSKTGGPLQIYDGKDTFMYKLIGVYSHQHANCSLGDKPRVYSRANRYLDWIEGHVWQ